jgi:hypothetical protein
MAGIANVRLHLSLGSREILLVEQHENFIWVCDKSVGRGSPNQAMQLTGYAGS